MYLIYYVYETVGTSASTRIDIRYIEKLGTAFDMWIKLQILIHRTCIYNWYKVQENRFL